ncbi:MAG: glycosyltransferase family 4 protein, partial [Methanotrichaceae archaeon]
MMKIGIISEYFPKNDKVDIRGGAEARAYYLAKNMAQNNDVTVITSREYGTNDRDIIKGIEIYRVGNKKNYCQGGFIKERLSFIKGAIQIGDKLDLDIVEGASFLGYPCAWKIGGSLNIPRVITYHDVWIGRWIKNIGVSGIYGEALERCMLSRKWNLIIANSKYTKDKLQACGINNTRIEIIYNGVDLGEYEHINATKFENPTISIVSRLVKYKHVDDIIKALSILKRSIAKIQLIIIGTGPEDINLKNLVRDLKLERNVSFLGFVEDRRNIIRIMKASHAFVLCSTVEGFGMVIIEAMASGTPYVASNIAPIREITGNGIGGLLYMPTDYQDLALKLKMVL